MKISGVSVSGGGGGLQGVHALIDLGSGYSVGSQMGAAGMGTGGGTTSNRLYAIPFIPSQTITCSALYVNCTSAIAGALVRILIYSNLNGSPSSKLYESTNLDCSTTGLKTATTSHTFNAGTTYWLCVHASSNAALTQIGAASVVPLRMGVNTVVTTHVYTTATFGSAPETISSLNVTFTSGNPYFIGITKA